MENVNDKREIALACEFLGALGLSVVKSIDTTRMRLILKFYDTFKDRREELREAFERPLGEVNEMLTVRIYDDEFGFDRRHPEDTEKYIEELRQNPQLLDKYYSNANPRPKDFIPLVKRSVYVKDPNGGKGYHEVTYNDIWLYYIFPEKNFALLNIDLREKIAERSRYAAFIYEEVCSYKFRFDSARKFFDMDENKIRLKFGLDRYVKKYEDNPEDETFILKSKGYTRSRDLYDKILKNEVEKVLKEFYQSKEMPFFIEIEKVEPRKIKRKSTKTKAIGRPQNTQPPRYRFWVKFFDIQDADAVEIKEDQAIVSNDVKEQHYLFRITLGEILRVNGVEDSVADEFSKNIAAEMKARLSEDPELPAKGRKKLDDLVNRYRYKVKGSFFDIVKTALWNDFKLGEQPVKTTRVNSIASEQDRFWPSDVEGQIAILKENAQKVYSIMEKFGVSHEFFNRILEDFKLRLLDPDKSGNNAMKKEVNAWRYLENWLNKAKGNYTDINNSNNGTEQSIFTTRQEREQAKRLNDAAEAIRDALNTPADYFGPEE